ncbi:unnamed protein product [Coregonus sp. 'balchen']|nr:unnamed protein product [Coregonus sp. 'balchen']
MEDNGETRSVPEDDLTCPVCFDIFKDPVVLVCSHSFCKACVEESWSHRQGRECPVGSKRSSIAGEPFCNLPLKNLSETFLLERRKAISGSEVVCSLHKEQALLSGGQETYMCCLSDHQKHDCDPISTRVQSQAQNTAQQIMGEFEKLHQFLSEEDAVRIAALKDEVEQKMTGIREKIEEMDRNTRTH